MKKFSMIIAIIFNVILLQGQMKNAEAIHIHANDTLKPVALEKFVNYLTENDILFFDTDYKKGIAKSEEYITSNWHYGVIMLVAKKYSASVSITITGYTTDYTGIGGGLRYKMIYKNGYGGAMFQKVKAIVEKYQGADRITYTKLK